MGNVFYLIYFLIFIYLIRTYYNSRKDKNAEQYMLLLVMAGLFYDNFISGIGFMIGEGTFLKVLNFFRYLFHAFFTPLLCVIAFGIARRMQVSIAQHKSAEFAVWAVTIVFMVLGFMHEIAPMDLVAKDRWGVLNYVHAKPSIPVAAILINVLVLMFGIAIWKKTGWPGLCISSIIMFFLAAIPSRNMPPIFGNAGEVIFIYGFLLTEKRIAPF